MSEDIGGKLNDMLTPYRLGLAKMTDSGRKVHKMDLPVDRRIALHVQALRAAGFPQEMMVVLLALAVDLLSCD